MAFHTRNLFSSFLSLPSVITASLVSTAVLLPVPASASTVWNWSFQTDAADQSGSGTLTTNDVIPTAFTTYLATSINGTYTRGGFTYAITGISNYFNADNTFQWDGTIASSIFTNIAGIAFNLDNDEQVNLYSNNAYEPANSTVTSFEGNDGDIISSSLSPASSPSVPGPLPLLGAAAAFSSSRRIRRRLAERV